VFRLAVLGDVDRLPDHLCPDQWLDGDWSGLMAPGAESDAGEPTEPDDRGGCGDT
jgi:hypothetical protein